MRTRSLRWSAVVLGACLALAACGGGGGSTSSGSSGRVSERGGTLYLLMSSGNPGTLDPSASYSGASENLSPLFISALTTYIPGTHPVQVTGNLATNKGIPSDGARVWTYHLKNVTYDNGQPVTSYDVKYDIERSFAASTAGGPPYLRMWLKGAANYKGPYVDKKGLSSIETPDAHTIIFDLNEPVGDFYYLATYPEFSGLPAAKDTGANYQYHMLTSGPYKIQKYVPDNTLVLVRNPLWKTSTDPYIKAYPDKIVVEEGLSGAVIDQRLIADNGPDKNAVALDDPIQPSDLSQVLANSSMRSRTLLQSGGGAITYVGLDVKKAPFNNVLVRQAVAWAVNKQTAQTALGGLYGGGAIANEILGPGITGYVPGNLYAGATGNPTKAKALLAQAGYPHGITTTLGVEDVPAQVNAAEALQTSLALAGIKVNIQQYSASTYFSGVIGVPSAEPPMAISAWGSDWPNPSTILPDLADGSQLSSSGPNNDITNFDSSSIDAEMIAADGMSSTAAAPLWAKIDTQVMQQAVIIPLIYSAKVFTVGSNVTGADPNDSFGSPNPTVISVMSKPKSG